MEQRSPNSDGFSNKIQQRLGTGMVCTVSTVLKSALVSALNRGENGKYNR
jgi:hypothetical protein